MYCTSSLFTIFFELKISVIASRGQASFQDNEQDDDFITSFEDSNRCCRRDISCSTTNSRLQPNPAPYMVLSLSGSRSRAAASLRLLSRRQAWGESSLNHVSLNRFANTIQPFYVHIIHEEFQPRRSNPASYTRSLEQPWRYVFVCLVNWR
jgi:hypothetical protein